MSERKIGMSPAHGAPYGNETKIETHNYVVGDGGDFARRVALRGLEITMLYGAYRARGQDPFKLPDFPTPRFYVAYGNRRGGHFAYVSVPGSAKNGGFVLLEGRMWRVVNVYMGGRRVVLFDGQNTRFYRSADGVHFHRKHVAEA